MFKWEYKPLIVDRGLTEDIILYFTLMSWFKALFHIIFSKCANVLKLDIIFVKLYIILQLLVQFVPKKSLIGPS